MALIPKVTNQRRVTDTGTGGAALSREELLRRQRALAEAAERKRQAEQAEVARRAAQPQMPNVRPDQRLTPAPVNNAFNAFKSAAARFGSGVGNAVVPRAQPAKPYTPPFQVSAGHISPADAQAYNAPKKREPLDIGGGITQYGAPLNTQIRYMQEQAQNQKRWDNMTGMSYDQLRQRMTTLEQMQRDEQDPERRKVLTRDLEDMREFALYRHPEYTRTAEANLAALRQTYTAQGRGTQQALNRLNDFGRVNEPLSESRTLEVAGNIDRRRADQQRLLSDYEADKARFDSLSVQRDALYAEYDNATAYAIDDGTAKRARQEIANELDSVEASFEEAQARMDEWAGREDELAGARTLVGAYDRAAEFIDTNPLADTSDDLARTRAAAEAQVRQTELAWEQEDLSAYRRMIDDGSFRASVHARVKAVERDGAAQKWFDQWGARTHIHNDNGAVVYNDSDELPALYTAPSGMLDGATAGGISDTFTRRLKYATEDEVAVYQYLHEIKDPQLNDVGYYFDMMFRDRESEDVDARQIWLADNAPPAAFVVSRLSRLMGQFEPAVDIVNQIVKDISGNKRPTDMNQLYRLNRQTKTIDARIAQNLDEAYGTIDEDVPIFGGKGVGALYDTASSIVDSWLGRKILGRSSAASFIAPAAASRMMEREARDDPWTNIVHGLTSGAIEYLTETALSVEPFFAIAGSNLPIPAGIALQGLAEGAEEGTSDILNLLADNLINGNKSELAQKQREYRNSGEFASIADADKQALKEWWGDVAFSSISGFVSGMAGMGVEQAEQSFSRISQGIQQNRAVGEQVLTNSGEQALGNIIDRLNSALAELNLEVEQISQPADQSPRMIGKKHTQVMSDAERLFGRAAAAEAEQTGTVAQQGPSQRILDALKDMDTLTRPKATEAVETGTERATDTPGTPNAAKLAADERRAGFKVSEDGQATVAGDDGEAQAVTPRAIKGAGTENVTVSVEDADGTVRDVPISDVQFANEFEADKNAYAAGMTNDALANTFRTSITEAQDMAAVSAGMEFAYRHGLEVGRYSDMLTGSVLVQGLTDAQVRAAYEIGKSERDAVIKDKQGAAEHRRAKLPKVGEFDYGTVDQTGLTPIQKRQMDIVGQIIKAAGLRGQAYESTAKPDGRFLAPNALVDKDGVIHIDVNAGRNNKGDSMAETAILGAAGHELTHVMQRVNPAAYEAYRQTVLEAMEAAGTDVQAMIDKIFRDDKSVKTRDAAIDEVVSNASWEMLNSSDFVDRLFKARPAQARTIGQRLVDFLAKIKAAIRKAFAGNTQMRAEVRAIIAETDRLSKMWADNMLEGLGVDESGAPQQLHRTLGRDLRQGNRQAAQAEVETPAQAAEAPASPERVINAREIVNDDGTVGAFGESAKPESAHIDNRTIDSVSEPGADVFANDYPMARQYYAAPAQVLLQDLIQSDKAISAPVGGDSRDGWIGVKRNTTPALAWIIDNSGGQWSPVQRVLERYAKIAETGDFESAFPNNKQARVLELELDRMLSEGYTTMDGFEIPADTGYLHYKSGLPGASESYTVPVGARDGSFSEHADGDVQYSARERDAEYLAAVERGDMETAQRMVDEAAKAAGYTLRGYHGTSQPTRRYDRAGYGDEKDYKNKRLPFTVFKTGQSGGIYVATKRAVSEGFKRRLDGAPGTVMSVYTRFANPFVVNEHIYTSVPFYYNIPTPTEMRNAGYKQADVSTEEISAYARKSGYDGVIVEGIREGGGTYTDDYIAFGSSQIKLSDPVVYDDSGSIIPLSERFNAENEDIRYSARDAQTDSAEFRKWFGNSKVVNEDGTPKVVYHGTARADRVGWQFRPERATSGPMAFFTDNEAIAENYSKNKSDTSLAYEGYDEYKDQFRIKIGSRDVPLYRAWSNIPYSVRKQISIDAGHVTYDDDAENIIFNEDVTYGVGGLPSKIKRGGGNVIRALVDEWLDSGSLFDEESRFMEVLELSGVSKALQDVGYGAPYYADPNYKEPKVYSVYLSIQNPLVTSNIKETLPARIKNWYKRQSKGKYAVDTANADMWDKRNIDIDDWTERLRDDIKNGTTHAWTSIPDAVTDYLKYKGYDGIEDQGGKMGGEGHTVYVPFSPTQIKSATDNAGTFDPGNPDIRYSAREVDSEGNELSAEQVEYFKDSKIRDANGRLLVVYHGVNDPDMSIDIERRKVVFSPKFFEFDVSGREDNPQKIEPGAWFSPDESVARAYGTPVAFYLNAVNPIQDESPIIGRPIGYDAIYRMRGIKNGIHNAWEIAVFDPSQIKLTTNAMPTSSPDIRYSARDPEAVSNREILATAFESVATNAKETNALKGYQKQVVQYDAIQADLDARRAEIKTLNKVKGKSAEQKAELVKLRNQADVLADKLARFDKKLLSFEAAAPLRAVAERERAVLKDFYADKITAAKLAERTKASAKYAQIKARGDERVAKVRARYEGKLTQQKQRTAERVAGIRTQRDRKLAEQKQRTAERIERMRQGRRDTETRRKMRKLIDEFERRLVRPREGFYVPDELRDSIVALGDGDLRASKGHEAQDMLRRILAAYKATEGVAGLENVYDAQVAELVEATAENIAERAKRNGQPLSIHDLTDVELERVYTVLKAIKHAIVTSIKLTSRESAQNAFEIGEAARQEMLESKGKYRSDFMEKAITMNLDAYGMFMRFGNQDARGAAMTMFHLINDGELHKIKLEMDANRIFDDVLDGRANEREIRKLRAYAKDALVDVGLKDAQGVAVPITRGMMLSVYRHLGAEQNLEHIVYGGLTVPELMRYYKGNSEAWGTGARRVAGIGGTVAQLRYQQRHARGAEAKAAIQAQIDAAYESGYAEAARVRQNIEGTLTDYERRLLASENIFHNDFARNAMNEATEKRYGYAIATNDNYFPINVDQRFLKGAFDVVTGQPSVAGMGIAQARVEGAKQPLLLRDMTDVLRQQIDSVTLYAAMLNPVNDFTKIYNTTLAGMQESLKETLASTFGKNAETWVKNYLSDAQRGRIQERSIFDKVKSNYAGAVLTANISSALKNFTAYFGAPAVVGWKHSLHALARGGKSKLPISRADVQLIGTYTPLLWDRARGMNSREMAEIKNMVSWGGRAGTGTLDVGKLMGVLDWINRADAAAAGRMWYAAEYYVAEQQPNLNKGTAEQIKAGESPFYQEVAKVYNQMIQRTQQSFTASQLADVLRNPNPVVRGMTMFISQPLKQFGMLYNTAAELRATAAKVKAGTATQEQLGAARRKLANNATSFMALSISEIIAGALASFVLHKKNPLNDDEEEWWEFLLWGMYSNLASTVAYGNYFADITEALMQGRAPWDIEHGSIAPINDFVQKLARVVNGFTKLMGDEYEDEEAYKEAVTKYLTGAVTSAGFSLAKLSGVPAENIYKLTNGIVRNFQDAINGEFGSMNAGADRPSKYYYDKLFAVALDGDEEAFDKLLEEVADTVGKPVPTIRGQVRSRVREQFVAGELDEQTAQTILQGSLASTNKESASDTAEWQYTIDTGRKLGDLKKHYMDGKVTFDEAVAIRIKYGLMKDDTADNEVLHWKYEKDTGAYWADLEYEYLTGKRSKEDTRAILMEYGEKDKAKANLTINGWAWKADTGADSFAEYTIAKDILRRGGTLAELNAEIANMGADYGKERGDVLKELKSYMRELVRDNVITPEKAISYREKYLGEKINDNDKWFDIKEYKYIQKNGSADGYKKYGELISAVNSGKNIDTWVVEYMAHGAKKGTISGQLSAAFKERYVVLTETNTDAANALLEKLLVAYTAAGYKRNERTKHIRKYWTRAKLNEKEDDE